MSLAPAASAPARRCRRAPRTTPLIPGGLRPSDVLAAFFALGILFLLAGAVVAVVHSATGWAEGHWLALHLVFVGGISQLVLGAGQFFAGAFLATDPPRRALIRLQLGTWNAGTVLVAVGVTAGVRPAVDAGAALLAVGLAAFAVGLRVLRRRSLQRAPWAVRWYQASALFLGVGVLAGAGLASDASWTLGSLLGAHMALNLAGWFGAAIVGTLHTFFPSLTQTQLRFGRLQRPTFAAWTGGTALLAAGYAFGVGPLVLAGWAALLCGAALLGANLVASLRAAPGPVALPARLVAAAQPFLVAALAVALGVAASGDATAPPYDSARQALAALLLPGWLGLTVAGALLHLLAVLVRVRDLRRAIPGPRPLRDRALVALAVAGAAALAIARGAGVDSLDTPATAALVAVYVTVGALVLARAARALRGRLPAV